MFEALAQRREAQLSLGSRLKAWISALFEGHTWQGIDTQRLVRSAAAAAAVVVLIGVAAVAVRSWRRAVVPQQALLRSRTGLVEVLPSGADEWLVVSEEVRVVEAGDRIRTGPAGVAQLAFFDGSATDLGAEAELTIAQLSSRRSSEGKTIVLHQWLGETRNDVQPLVDEESRFKVETASAVISVRGTSFTLSVEPDGATRLEVHEGVVEVQTREASTLVRAGEEVWVVPPRPSPTPTATPAPTSTPTASGPDEEVAVPPPVATPWSLWWRGIVYTPEALEGDEMGPPGQTRTPQPPGQTATPQPPGQTEEPPPPSFVPPGLTRTPQPPGLTKTPQPPGLTKVPPGQEDRP